jgi:hypothetical protein
MEPQFKLNYFIQSLLLTINVLLFKWQCSANLENGVQFGKTNIICEGYDRNDDPYILPGSCGVI